MIPCYNVTIQDGSSHLLLRPYDNVTIDTPFKLTCFSRPRRFGKSYAAKMLCAYYDRSCDSAALFEGLDIAKAESYETYRNQYDVIYLDITRFISRSRTNGRNIVAGTF